jgi:glycosyltransferase involved in cell wall biosynthesis
MVDQFPLVTVVTPSFNQAEYLEQTIVSVLEQDYPTLEYMVVDGGSTDGSVEIIKKYADRLAWWVSEKDNGQADAINKGLSRAKGEIVAWLNSDDVYLPGSIRRAVETLQEHPEAGLVYGKLLSINARGEHVNTIEYKQYALEDLLAFFIIGQPTVFMRGNLLRQVGSLDESYNYLLDHQLWLRFAELAPMVYVPRPAAAARYHPTAKNMAQAEHFGQEAYRILEWAQTQPKMAAVIENAHHRVWGGAHRFNARYLLDAGLPLQALKTYGKVIRHYPEFAFQRLHRIFFALISLVGLGRLRRLVYRRYLVSPEKPAAAEPVKAEIKQVKLLHHHGEEATRRDTLPPILVTGVHRSSTTWVGKMLAANRKYAYVSEPLNVLHRKGVMRIPVKHWYTYVCNDNEHLYLSAFYETMRLRYHTMQEFGTLRSPKDLGRMMRDWSAFTAGRLGGKQVLLKDPFAVFSADWFSRRLGCAVVIAVRHPAAFVSSLKRLDWPFEFEDLLAQPYLMRDWLEPFREDIQAAQEAKDDMVFQGSVLWRVIYSVVWEYSQRFPAFQIVRHEDLSLDPMNRFKALYDALGVPFTARVAKTLLKSTNPGNPTELPLDSIHAVRLDSKANLKNWQKRLTPDEIERVQDLTGDVAGRYYSDEDWK